MTLTLRIENYGSLEDGGPLWLSLDRQSASVGRGRSMDWVLPDPAKHISSHHFNITYSDNAYWITDVSTNGTFIQGQRHRLEGPYCLRNGERLLVGHYIIGVQVAAPPVAADPFGGHPHQPAWDTPAAVADDIDPWEFGGASAPQMNPLPPVNPVPPARPMPPLHGMGSDFMPLQQPGHHPGGGHSPAIQTPGMQNHGHFDRLDQPLHPQSGAPYAAPDNPALQQPGLPQNSAPVTTPPFGAQAPYAPPPALQMPGVADTPRPAPMPPVPPAPQAVVPAQPPALPHPAAGQPAPSADAAGHDAIIAAFCAGAGINPSVASGVPADALAHLLGQVVRASTEEIMRMLHDRSNVKHFTKGGERTMRSATGNNPLKFLPDADQAIEAMFLRPRDGFMTGPDGFRNALKDLSAHQLAVFAALQPALASVLDGISPEQIEAAETTGNLLGGSRKGKAWDLFVKRWEEKENSGEHGMLDAFLTAFARAYAQANARSD